MFDRIQGIAPGAIQAYAAKSALFTTTSADRGKVFDCTGSFTITLGITDLVAGWSAWFRNVSGTQTLDPAGALTINGATTYSLSNPGDMVLVTFDGTNFILGHTQLPAAVAISGGSISGVTLGATTIAEAKDVTLGTATGTKIGTAVGQKLSFWGATPVVQPSGAGQAAAAAQTQTTVTDSTGGSVSTTLAAITAGAAYAQADMTAVKNAIASIAAQLAFIKADMTAVKTLEDALRTALVASGNIKGAA